MEEHTGVLKMLVSITLIAWVGFEVKQEVLTVSKPQPVYGQPVQPWMVYGKASHNATALCQDVDEASHGPPDGHTNASCSEVTAHSLKRHSGEQYHHQQFSAARMGEWAANRRQTDSTYNQTDRSGYLSYILAKQLLSSPRCQQSSEEPARGINVSQTRTEKPTEDFRSLWSKLPNFVKNGLPYVGPVFPPSMAIVDRIRIRHVVIHGRGTSSGEDSGIAASAPTADSDPDNTTRYADSAHHSVRMRSRRFCECECECRASDRAKTGNHTLKRCSTQYAWLIRSLTDYFHIKTSNVLPCMICSMLSELPRRREFPRDRMLRLRREMRWLANPRPDFGPKPRPLSRYTALESCILTLGNPAPDAGEGCDEGHPSLALQGLIAILLECQCARETIRRLRDRLLSIVSRFFSSNANSVLELRKLTGLSHQFSTDRGHASSITTSRAKNAFCDESWTSDDFHDILQHPSRMGRCFQPPTDLLVAPASFRNLPNTSIADSMDLDQVGNRLATLRGLPPSCPWSHVALAEAGFHYNPRVTPHAGVCHRCAAWLGLSYTADGESCAPLAVHQALSPHCPLVTLSTHRASSHIHPLSNRLTSPPLGSLAARQAESPLSGQQAVSAQEGSPLSGQQAVSAQDGSPLSGQQAVSAQDGSPLSGQQAVSAQDGSPLSGANGRSEEDGRPARLTSSTTPEAEDADRGPPAAGLRANVQANLAALGVHLRQLPPGAEMVDPAILGVHLRQLPPGAEMIDPAILGVHLRQLPPGAEMVDPAILGVHLRQLPPGADMTNVAALGIHLAPDDMLPRNRVLLDPAVMGIRLRRCAASSAM